MRYFLLCTAATFCLTNSSVAWSASSGDGNGTPSSLEEAMEIIARLQAENAALKNKTTAPSTPTAKKSEVKQAPANNSAHTLEKIEKAYAQTVPPHKTTTPVGNLATTSSRDLEIRPRVDTFVKMGNERSILGTQYFQPLSWNGRFLSFADIRLIADSQSELEGNFGLGLRHIPKGEQYILGTYAFLDHRRSEYDNTFNQITLGGELLTNKYDLRLNYYQTLSDPKTISETTSSSVKFTGNTLVANQSIIKRIETPLSGFDLEAGAKIPYLDNVSLYGGGYYFHGDDIDSIKGVRARARWRINDWLQLGFEHQQDNVRGGNNIAEVRLRFPLGNYKSSAAKPTGIYARLDEDIVRDIDIVTEESSSSTPTAQNKTVLNAATNTAQQIIHVDNTAAAGGNGTAERPYNTLASAQAAALANEMIYVHTGDGSSTGQNSGITLSQTGLKLIGQGTAISLQSLGLKVPGISSSTIVLPSGIAPLIERPTGIAVNITADDVQVAGIRIGATGSHGIQVTNADNVKISNTIFDTIGNSSGDYGIYGSYTTAGPWNLDISGNSFNNTFNNSVYIRTQNTADLTLNVANNSIDFAGGNAVYLRSDNTSNITSTITNNTFTNSIGHGIYAQLTSSSTQDLTISNNTLTGNNYGVYVQGQGASNSTVSITDNSISRNRTYGIEVTTATTSDMDATISNNTIENNGNYGIYVLSQSALSVDILNNILRDNGNSGATLLSQSSATLDGTVSGNTFSYNTNYGININSTGTSTITLDVLNNQVFENSLYGIYNYAQTNSVMNTTIAGNIIYGNNATGLYLRTANNALQNISVSNNIIRDNNLYGVYVDDDLTLSQNIDLGGGPLGSTGGNSIYSNVNSDILVDMDGDNLMAEGNWWGSATGLSSFKTTLQAGSTIDADPFLTEAP